MSDPSLSKPETNPDRSVVAAQNAQPMTTQNVQGSSMLDASITTGEPEPTGDPIEHPIATNFSGATDRGDAKTAGVSGEMGAFTASGAETEKGAVNLHNNPDVPGDPAVQGTLPDSDPLQMPTDPETNLPD